ncbi:MAG: hypothetical protein ACRDNZ_12990 [Streptosporangiaceae bacterium]
MAGDGHGDAALGAGVRGRVATASPAGSVRSSRLARPRDLARGLAGFRARPGFAGASGAGFVTPVGTETWIGRLASGWRSGACRRDGLAPESGAVSGAASGVPPDRGQRVPVAAPETGGKPRSEAPGNPCPASPGYVSPPVTGKPWLSVPTRWEG